MYASVYRHAHTQKFPKQERSLPSNSNPKSSCKLTSVEGALKARWQTKKDPSTKTTTEDLVQIPSSLLYEGTRGAPTWKQQSCDIFPKLLACAADHMSRTICAAINIMDVGHAKMDIGFYM